MRRNKQSTWAKFRALPGIAQFGAWLALVILVMLCLPGPVNAGELVARQGDDEVRLFDSPCVHAGTLGRLPPPVREKFSKATGRFSGQMFYGCWRQQGNAAVLLWEDGDQGVIPMSELKPTHDGI